MNTPPPLPLPTTGTPKGKSNLRILYVVVGTLLFLLLLGYLGYRSLLESGLTKGPDNLFGDQHLKTAVALIELHKVRFGKYPDTLRDLKFTGQWDQLALSNVGYYPSTDRTAYFVEVNRGWVGKPDLQMPEEFWHGTGYTESLKPKRD